MHFLGKTLLVFALLHSTFQGQIYLLLQVFLDFYFCIPVPYDEKDIFLGISKLKWTGMGEFNSDDHYIYYCGQESLRRNGVAIMVNKRVRYPVLGCNLTNDRMISVCLQGKPFNITVIQVYAPTSNTEEAEVEQFYEDLQDLLELTPPSKDVLFIKGGWNAKVGNLFWVLVLKGLVGLHRTVQLQLLQCYWLGHRLGSP